MAKEAIYGYVRVSTKEQNTDRQDEIMKKYSIDKLYSEKISGKNTDRPELQKLLERLEKGDTVVVESYSRLARNTKDLLELVDQFDKKGVKFISDKEDVDTSSPQGRLMLNIFASLSQFERELTLQRQAEGIAVAKEQGKYKGRQPIKRPSNFKAIYDQWQAKAITGVQAMKLLNLSKTTFYKMVKEYEKEAK